MMLTIFFIVIFIGGIIGIMFFLYKKEKYERIKYSKNNILDYDIDKNGLINIYPENEEDDLPYLNYNYDNSVKYTNSNYIRHNRQRNNYNRNIHSNIIY